MCKTWIVHKPLNHYGLFDIACKLGIKNTVSFRWFVIKESSMPDIGAIVVVLRFNKLLIPIVFWDESDHPNSKSLFGPEEFVDAVEHELQSVAESRGLPYMRPILSKEVHSIAEESFEFFKQLYVRALRNAKSGGMNFVYL